MANSNTPFGLRPVSASGAKGAPIVHWYPLDTSNNILAQHDPVALTSAGLVDRWGTSNTGAITVASYGPILGSVAGFKPAGGAGYPNEASTSTNRERTYASASLSGSWLVGVYDDPDQEFEIQCDDGGSLGIVQTYVGNVANVLMAAGAQFSTCTGRSKVELDISTAGAGTADVGYAFRIMRLRNAIGDVYASGSTGIYAKVIVKISAHQARGQAVGTVATASATPGV